MPYRSLDDFMFGESTIDFHRIAEGLSILKTLGGDAASLSDLPEFLENMSGMTSNELKDFIFVAEQKFVKDFIYEYRNKKGYDIDYNKPGYSKESFTNSKEIIREDFIDQVNVNTRELYYPTLEYNSKKDQVESALREFREKMIRKGYFEYLFVDFN